MSSIVNDLNQIYNIKQQIKEVANIDTDNFSYYPELISYAIQSGGATGEIEITTNGTHDVSTYASAYVNVPQEEVPVVPPGYSYVEGTKTITENGTVDVSSYASAYVQVPIPEGFIYPTGYAYITTNGDFPIREFQYVNVNVPTSGGLDWDDVAEAGYIVPAGTLNVIANGTVDVSAYENATVNVPIPSGYIIPTGTINITTNEESVDIRQYAYASVEVPSFEPTGTYSITTNGTHNVYDYETAYVNVPQGVVPTGNKNITTNGQYDVASYEFAYVTVAAAGTQLSYVWGADEYDANVFIPFTDNGTSYSYSVAWNWDGSQWTSLGQQSGFSLCCRVGNETSYEYISDQDVLVNTYRGIQMHVANGSLYFGDLLTNIPSLSEYSGSISIASDLGSTQFYNNSFWTSPDNFDPECDDAELTFTLTVPKDFYYSFGTGYDKIDSGDVRTINHPTVTLSWTLEKVNQTCPNCGEEVGDYAPTEENPCPYCGWPNNEEPEPEEEPEE